MNRTSVSNRRVSTLPFGLVAVPVPCTSATPTKPLKSVRDDGSTPGPKNVKWKSTPPSDTTLVVGLGAAEEDGGAAAATAGPRTPAPNAVPVTPAAAPIN